MKLNNKYFLLRHGQTIYQKEQRGMNYDLDSPQKLEITEDGREMVKESVNKLKEFLNNEGLKIDIVFASPYLRTRQSAEIALNILGVENIKYDDRLVDLQLGIFLGRPMEESNKFYFSGSDLFNNRPKNGESWNDVLARAKSFLDEINEKYQDKNILIISHADPIWIMAGYLKGITSPEKFLEIREDRNNFYPRVAQIIKI